MKKALIIDWLDKYGGAERVISSLHDIFEFNQIYSLINVMRDDDLTKMFPKSTPQIKVTFVQKLGKKFRYFFFTFPFFISKVKVCSDVKLIISSSHAVAKGVKKSSIQQIHISYFQARNCNFIWNETNLYFGKFSFIFFPFFYILRRIDKKQAQRPDYIISNSKFVQKWVKETYNRESTVIYPPINFSKFTLNETKSDYYVAVGRIAQIKRFDVVLEAFKINNKKLILIGDGELYETFYNLKTLNVEMTGFLNSDEVAKIVSKAKAFIQVGVEGFGIAPLEAQSCGTPVIAYAEGGVLETVLNKETGIFFGEQNAKSLNEAIEKFENLEFNPREIRNHALEFSEEKFIQKIKAFVIDKLQDR